MNLRSQRLPLPESPLTWKAIFAPQHNTYYFYDSVTPETTWINPLSSEQQQQQAQPEASTTTFSPLSATATSVVDTETAALAQGIDPSLLVPGCSGSSPLFTGQFTPASARTPGHLWDHERTKRMSEFYFGKWEEDLARRGGRLMGEEGTKERKRKRPSKKDLVWFFFVVFDLFFIGSV